LEQRTALKRILRTVYGGDIGKVIGGMTVSLDGFVNDRNGSVEHLYPDLDALR